jgi:transposase
VAGGSGVGPASEKKSLHATERDTEENRRRREVFLDQLRSTAPEQLIFLDESGVSTQMTRRYARAPRGVRVHETTPEGNWKILTILGAMSLSGMIATMTIEAATDAEIFLAYLDHVLCPVLRPGNVVVMDNLSSHKVAGVRERIAAVGAELLYLPPYSPDLNPIEKAWAKLKQLLRSARPEPLRHSTRRSLNCYPTSDHKTPKHGSEHLFMLYSKEEYALGGRVDSEGRLSDIASMEIAP